MVKKKILKKNRQQLLKLLDELFAMTVQCVGAPPELGKKRDTAEKERDTVSEGRKEGRIRGKIKSLETYLCIMISKAKAPTVIAVKK